MIVWKLSEQQADYIMKVLATRPYGEVAQLVQELVNQANGGTPVAIPKPVAQPAAE